MRTKPNYYTIGIFVSAGLVLILGALIILGAASIWREYVYIETYVDESIQGVDVGSAVKMRGVQIGNVQRIGFVNINYPEASGAKQRYVMLEISISLKAFGDMTPTQLASFLEEEVDNGLRIRMLPMGLTGSAYMEMDYLDPVRHPPPPIEWTPATPYIPSAPGAFARLEETFETISNTLAKLEDLKLDQTLDHLDQLITSLSNTVNSLDMEGLSTHASLFLKEMRESNRKLSMIVGPESDIMEENVNFYSVMADTRAVIREIRAGLDRLKIDQDDGAMDQLTQSIADMRLAFAGMPETLESIREAAQSMRQSTEGFSSFTRRTYSLLATQSEQIESIMRDLEITSRNLMEFSTDARSYPSYMFFGDKPREIDKK
jgi:hypothetical protein